MVINDTWLLSGGQPVEDIERALRGMAAEVAGTMDEDENPVDSGA
jgi:hypothetical protein